MFRIETFRLIKKTYKRFIAIVLIVFIGVAFMMGLMNTATIMKESVTKYAQENNLQDIQIYSSYGFCNEDIDALKELENIEAIYPSKLVDTYGTINNSNTSRVIRLREMESDVNRYVLIEGRLPEKENEVAICKFATSTPSIGSILHLYLDDEEELDEKLSCKDFEVVGIVESPEFLARFAGTSTLKNLDIDIVCYAQNNIFKADYYTTLYLTFNDTNDITQFNNAYKKIVKEDISDVQSLAHAQQEYRKNIVYEEVKAEIEDGEKELLEQKTKGQKELDDAKKKLDNANIQLIAGQLDLETVKSLYETTKERINGSRGTYEEESAQNQRDIEELESRFGKTYDNALIQVAADYQTYTSNENTINSSEDESITALKNQRDQLIAQRDTLDPLSSEYQLLNTEIGILDNQISNLEQVSEQTKQQLTQNNQNIDNKYIAMGYEGVEDAYTSVLAITTEKTALTTSKMAIDESYGLLEELEIELADKQVELDNGKKEYEKGYQDYLEGLNTFNNEIEKAEVDIRLAYQELEDLPDANWTILDRDSHYSSYMFENNANQMQAIGIAIPMLFCLVAALVCMTTMTRLIDEQRGSIGTFVALGYQKYQIIAKYLVYAFLASIIGSCVGVVVGNFIFPTVIYETWKLMYEFPTQLMLFPIRIVLLCVSVFSILMMSVTYFVVRKTLKEKAAELMRPKAPKNAKKIFLENISFVWKRLSFTSKITARNLIRYKARFFMTVIGVAGCAGLLVIGFGVRDSIADVVDKQYGQILNYDYSVNLKNEDDFDEIVETLESNYDNETIVPYMSYYSKANIDGDEKTVIVETYDPRKSDDILSLTTTNQKQSIKIENSGVIITEKFSKNYGIKIGDTITIESKSGIKADVQVKNICKWYFQHYVFMSESYYEQVFNESIHYTSIALKTFNYDTMKQSLKDFESINSITDFSGFISQFDVMIQALDIIIWVIILTAGALAFVVLMNLTNVNISERIKEIATLKVLGFRNYEINGYIFKEILLLTIIGSLIGLPLGKIEENWIMSVINMDNIMFGTDIHLPSYLYAFAITIIFTVIVLQFTKKPLREVEMVESLKSIE